MPPKITVEKAMHWRARTALVYREKEMGLSVREIALRNRIHEYHVRRLLRVWRGLGSGMIDDPRLDRISLETAEKMLTISPAERRAILAKKRGAVRPKEIKLIAGGEEIPPSKRARMIESLRAGGMKKYEIAQKLGVDAGSITHWLAFLELIPPIQRAVDKGAITMSAARALTGMNERGQRLIWERHQDQFSNLGVRELTAMIREKYPPLEHSKLYAHPERSAHKEEQRINGRWSKTDETEQLAIYFLQQIC